MDLYADGRTTFWKVTFPLIFPGILSAALLAFALSIDDYVITLFSAGQTQTFPLWVFGVSRLGIPPEVNVLGTLIFLVAFVFIGVQLWASGGRAAARPGRSRWSGGNGHGTGWYGAERRTTAWRGSRLAGASRPGAAGLDALHRPGGGARRGLWIETIDGERYLDYTCGIGVTNTGHAHPRVSAAIAEQAGKIIHAQQNILYHQPGLELHERLPRTFPGLEHGEEAGLFLSNSGAEAIEAAVKLAKYATRRPGIIAFRGGFHGRTHGAMSLTSSGVKYRGHYEPLLAGVHFAAFPYALRNPTGRPRGGHRLQPGVPGGAVRHRHLPGGRGRAHRGADPGRGRLRGPAGRLPAGAARGRRSARHPAHRRRGADRRRPHRPHVGQRMERRAARHPGHGQGHRLRHAAVRDHGPPRPAGPSSARAPTAAPMAATRSPAPRRWPRWT